MVIVPTDAPQNTVEFLLGTINSKLDTALSQLLAHTGEIKSLTDRVSSLERWRAYLIGLAVASGAGGYFIGG